MRGPLFPSALLLPFPFLLPIEDCKIFGKEIAHLASDKPVQRGQSPSIVTVEYCLDNQCCLSAGAHAQRSVGRWPAQHAVLRFARCPMMPSAGQQPCAGLENGRSYPQLLHRQRISRGRRKALRCTGEISRRHDGSTPPFDNKLVWMALCSIPDAECCYGSSTCLKHGAPCRI